MKNQSIAALLGLLLGCWLQPCCAGQEVSKNSPPTSPRLTALKKQLEAGDAAAIEGFWREMSGQGTPLIETIPGDNKHLLMTFLWRTSRPVKNVVLVDGPAGDDYANNQLNQLGNTGLWYRTYRVRSDARFYYSFSVNDPLIFPTDEKGWRQRSDALQADPLNRHAVVFPKDEDAPNSKEEVLSAVELPGTPQEAWTAPRTDISAGKVELHQMKSTLLNNERRVWAYTPPGYDHRGKPYRLLILFDGWLYVRVIPTPTILDNLRAEKRIPPFVAVLVDNFLRIDPKTCGRELAYSERFADFVAQELIPWIHAHYNVTSDPGETIVGGLSAGGGAAAFVALRHPELFGNALSQSGAFQNEAAAVEQFFNDPEDRDEEWLIRQFVAAPKLPLRFYLEAGLYECFGNFSKGPTLLLANRHLRDVLLAKGYPIYYSEFAGDHSELSWKGTLAHGLILLAAPQVERRERKGKE